MAVFSFGSDAKKTGVTLAVLLASCCSLLPSLTFANSDLSSATKSSGTKSAGSKPGNSKASSASPSAGTAANSTSTTSTSATSSSASTAAAASAAAATKDVVRLTKSVKPSHYDLTFEPDLEKFTYTGTETIALNVAEPTNVITLNALDMTLSSVELEAVSGGKKLRGKVEMDAANEQAHLRFDSKIAAGKYKLHINFNSILNDQLRGFYRSYYKNNLGEKHWLCSSQMEPADARRMFPCFDEPEFKATFKLSAVVNPKLTAISNAPIEREILQEGKKIFEFETSPKMSTYLMCLVVGDFKSTEERKSCDVPIRVWAPAGQEKMGEYALGAACEIMTFLQDYFGIKFPAKKLDLIAIPDFAPGAMENLGAITFKDSLLLIDEKTGSNFARRSAFSVIAHEMAHQWFGDLVTSRWWDDLWLNEAFATWTATKTENALKPEWRIRSKAVLDCVGSMSTDELKSTRAIHSHVGNPKQASEMFDTITYDKGSGVLRMLEVFVGENVFQKGVHDYLEAHKFDNATSEDLWASIGAAAKGIPVPKMMETWIMQPGFPLITASEQDGGKVLSVTQEKFFVMPDSKPDASSWLVPIMARELKPGAASNSSDTKAFLLERSQDKFTLPAAWNPTVLNAGASGFYRVQYSQDTLKKILDNFRALTPDERIKLISDVATLSWKGSIPVENNLDLMLKLKGEDDIVVQGELVDKFKAPRHFMDAKSKPLYEKFVRANLQPLKDKLGWAEKKGEEETVKDLRASVIHALGTYGQDKSTIDEARVLYGKYLKDRQSVDPNIIGSAVTIVAYNGNDRDYDEMKLCWRKASNPQEEKRFLMALASYKQPELVEKTLNLAIGPDTRATDAISLLTALLSNHDSHEQAWKFTKAHLETITKKCPPRFNKRLIAACDSFDTPDVEKDLTEFFAAHPLEMSKSALSRMLERVRVAVLYRQRSADAIQKWVLQQAAALRDV